MNMIEKAKYATAKKNKIIETKTKCKTEIDAIDIIIKTPSNTKFKQNIQKNLPQSINLCKIIDEDKTNFSRIVANLEILNRIMAYYIIKPKISMKTVELKIKNETKKKEKEFTDMKKNLEEKIDSALEKANSCLDNIKQMSKGKKIQIIGTASKMLKITIFILDQTSHSSFAENKILTNSTNKEKSQMGLTELVKNLSNENKYNTELKVNEDNLNSYFMMIAENRNILKDLRERNKSLKMKIKNSKKIFCDVYNKSSSSILKKGQNSEEAESESNRVLQFNSNFYKNLNSTFLSYSIINTLLFEKLYIKVLYHDKENENGIFLFDVFSLWFLLKNIKSFQNDEVKNSQHDSFCVTSMMKKEKNKFPKFIKLFSLNVMNNYLDILFKSRKNNDKFNLNEEEIFGKEFFQIYENFMKIIKMKYLKIVNSHLSSLIQKQETMSDNNCNNSNISEQHVEELKYFKNIYAMLVNNCGYSYQICKKSNLIIIKK